MSTINDKLAAKTAQLISQNPFYGLEGLQAFLGNVTKGSITPFLTKAWEDAKKSYANRQLFWTVAFSIGDVTNRSHNILTQLFEEDVIPNGGSSCSPQWIEILKWGIKNEPAQIAAFIPTIIEFVGLRELTTYQIRTAKHTKNVVGNWGLLQDIQSNEVVYAALLDWITSKISSNNVGDKYLPFYKHQIAKFVKIPRFSQRQKRDKEGKLTGQRALQPQTIGKMNAYKKLIEDISSRLSLAVTKKETHVEYTGYRSFQAANNKDLESVVFSTKTALGFDKEVFLKWISHLPGGARDRVRRRILQGKPTPTVAKNEAKWPNLAKWFLEFESRKDKKQEELRVLKNQIATRGVLAKATPEEEVKLKKLEKQAKVNTGASTLFDELKALVMGLGNEQSAKIQMESVFNKIKFDAKVLTVVDTSGSMGMSSGLPIKLACITATAALLKNEANPFNVVVAFDKTTRFYADGSKVEKDHPFLRNSATIKYDNWIDKTKSFYENYKIVSAALAATGDRTDISSIAVGFENFVNGGSTPAEKDSRKEEICSHPIMLIISDGEFNNLDTPGSSLAQLQMDLLQKFGYSPLIVLWDVPRTWPGENVYVDKHLENKSGNFKNLKNVVYMASANPGDIQNIFTNLGEFDIVDVYTALKAMYENIRYTPVRDNVIAE